MIMLKYSGYQSQKIVVGFYTYNDVEGEYFDEDPGGYLGGNYFGLQKALIFFFKFNLQLLNWTNSRSN